MSKIISILKKLRNFLRTENVQKISYSPLAIGNYSEAIYSRGNCCFDVEVSIMKSNVNMLHFPSDKWHFYTQACFEILKNNELTYAESIINKFYKKYQPSTLLDIFFFADTEKQVLTEDEKKYLQSYDVNKTRFDLWGDRQLFVQMDSVHEYGLLRSHGTQFYGPVSDEKGELEFSRLKNALLSIEKNGYRPETFGYLTGYFLQYKNQYVFVVVDGNHRAGIVAALNYKKIPVIFHPGFPRVINYDDIENFPLVRKGIFSKALAQKIFINFFNDVSTGRAAKLGLASPEGSSD